MSLKCIQGDLAYVIKSFAGNEGKVVTCDKFIGPMSNMVQKDFWQVSPNINSNEKDGTIHEDQGSFIPDSFLRPIRPTDEMDEMLRITGLPKKTKEQTKMERIAEAIARAKGIYSPYSRRWN